MSWAGKVAEEVMEFLPAMSNVAEPDNLHVFICNSDSRF
jgi:hypothetical protein